ncbi:MAG: hypothetical protein A3F67_09600 [Verrucomicrobia bacterium RIFCSPHIGHO2_12_FULL_41_10]|nr:MAG: hypothetical protein A3F67_09600 [Verrucomicrobia bacterium RIFCSPHIGHO2_12_FULL_41_10]
MPPALPPESARSWCILLHLLGLSGLILPIFLANIVAPLSVWLFKREMSSEIDATGKEVLNFQISFTIYLLVSGILCFVVVGFVLAPIVFIAWLILPIRAAIKTSNGVCYRYPMTIQFLK